MVSRKGEKVSLKTPLVAKSANSPTSNSTFKTQLETSTTQQNQSLSEKLNLNSKERELERERGKELDTIGNLTLENAKLEDRILDLERNGRALQESIKGLKRRVEIDAWILISLRVDIARWGQWWWWGEDGEIGGAEE